MTFGEIADHMSRQHRSPTVSDRMPLRLQVELGHSECTVHVTKIATSAPRRMLAGIRSGPRIFRDRLTYFSAMLVAEGLVSTL